MAMRALAAACILAGMAGSAHAATMTFDGIDAPVTVWEEDGIRATASGGDLGGFPYGDGTAHLDDGGSPYTNAIVLTMFDAASALLAFNATSFDILPFGSSFGLTRDDGTFEPVAFDNVLLTGLRDGVVVAQQAFEMGTDARSIDVGSAFRNLTALVVGFAPLPNLGPDPDGGQYGCIDNPCTHFSIDNVVLAPVPLPAGGMLLLLGVGVLASLSCRTRNRRGGRRP